MYFIGVVIIKYLPETSIKKRLETTNLFLKIKDNTKEYIDKFHSILQLVTSSINEEENINKAINLVIYYFTIAMKRFAKFDDNKSALEYKKLFYQHQEKYTILKNHLIVDTLEKFNTNYKLLDIEEVFIDVVEENTVIDFICETSINSTKKEASDYSKRLYDMKNPNFTKIRQISFDYIKSIGDPYELFERLERGVAIIDDEKLLYKYLVAFGEKHKAKLVSAFEKIIDQLEDTKFNIVDWGCGQAFATMMLLEFARERKIDLDISDICLIEPSKLALSRGLLHVDVLKSKDYNLKAINSDIDCLKNEDVSFNNGHKTLHLFSNILDVESFSLDISFLKKIATNIKSDNLFVCVSPNINDKRNSRTDLFYKHFDDNFDTELISSRDTCTNDGHKRYEKIFQVKYTKQEVVEQSRQEIQTQDHSHLNIYDELKSYKEQIAPILDVDRLKESIQKDPEYLIFKTRKAAEVITSKIYANYESNSKNISFNDMIRYLSFEKRLFNKKITSNLHTIRTIGNINVHEDNLEIDEQKLDAHLMLVSLLILCKELENKKLF